MGKDRELKATLAERDNIKLNRFCMTKGNHQLCEEEIHKRERIFVNNTSDQGLIHQIDM